MYHHVKRLTTILSVVCFGHIFVTLMFAFYFPNSGLDMSTIIIFSVYLALTATILSVLTFALRSLCDALELNFEKDADNVREIKKRLHILEETKK